MLSEGFPLSSSLKSTQLITHMSDNQKALYIRLLNHGCSRLGAREIVKAHPVLINRRLLPALVYQSPFKPANV